MAHRMLLAVSLVLSLVLSSFGVAVADKLDDLSAKLSDPNSNNTVRLKATMALGKLKDKRAIVPLTKALADEDKVVRHIAALYLGTLLDAGVDAATRNAAINALHNMSQNDADASNREDAARIYNQVRLLRTSSGTMMLKRGLPLMKHANAVGGYPTKIEPTIVAVAAPAAAPEPAVVQTRVTNDQIAAAPDTLRALRLALEECDAETLGWWIRFPLSYKGATYADKAALKQECRRGAAPTLDAQALEQAMGGMQVALDGELRVVVDHTAWRFEWRNRQWWLVAIE